ncbi:MAG: hybrid sensor histidine kinase/response regulator [Magnetococcales bacterium]|nr:hybrid sensor histidine kinase/response regulator [Magnetococcales bacterium]
MNTEPEQIPPPDRPKILLVDDMPMNLKLLVNATRHQYRPMVANRGEIALHLAEQERPDLILLDIMMPGMDGYAVCRQLKAQETTRDIPVIFITAMTDETDEMKGLEAGAVDYITKPFSIPVVLARIATHLALRDSYRRLEQQYAALREMDQLRKDVEAITRHDMKSPIDGIIGCATLLLRCPSLSPAELQGFHQMILDAARQLREMVNLSLNVLKMEQGHYTVVLQPIDLLPILRHVLADHQALIEQKKAGVRCLVDGHPEQEAAHFMVLGDDTLCYTMLANLFKNAVEASAMGQPVDIVLQSGEQATIAIHNQGVVPEEVMAHFFDKYYTHGKRGGTGLGTYSARLMAETQKGHIHMHSSEAAGTTVTIILPQGEKGG